MIIQSKVIQVLLRNIEFPQNSHYQPCFYNLGIADFDLYLNFIILHVIIVSILVCLEKTVVF